jgi:pimeloyl-ACP methyl ester carboxylesterase
VLLHGGSGSWVYWVRNIAELVRCGYQVHIPDLPGFGASSLPPVGFDAVAHVEWILLGLEKLLDSKSCSLVGFSFGAMVAALAAAQGPAIVDRLVLVGAPALVAAGRSRVNIKDWRALADEEQVRQAHRHNLRTIMLARDESVSDLAVDLFRADAALDRIPQRRLFKTDILSRQMPFLQCPVWGIWGGEDALHRGDMEAIRKSLAKATKFKELVVIADAGHWVQFESSERFNQVLCSILQSSIQG